MMRRRWPQPHDDDIFFFVFCLTWYSGSPEFLGQRSSSCEMPVLQGRFHGSGIGQYMVKKGWLHATVDCNASCYVLMLGVDWINGSMVAH
uniref:Uncharacterized protein n=1 Tax=Oryza barthii TaxID=65489 RepID=A0A0D3F4C1_9ORYZ